MRINLKGINTIRKRLTDGSIRQYYYHRTTGTRLSGKPGSPTFIADYEAAERAISERKRGSFESLVRDFTLSPEFAARGEGTRREYIRMLRKAEQKFASLPLAALNDPRVRQDFTDWRADVARSSGLREGDNRLAVISAMLSWGVDTGRIRQNHLLNFKRLYRSDRAEIVWLPEHVAAFMNTAPLELQRALILALHTGQRQGDLLQLRWSNYDGEYISLRQAKSKRAGFRGKLINIPCTAALRSMLDGMDQTSDFILKTKTGQPFKKRYFSRLWSESMIAANIESVKFPHIEEPQELHFHDLRGTAVTMLNEAGCAIGEIVAITGHSLKTAATILEQYLARTKHLADSAMAKFEAAPSAEFANRLQTKAPEYQNGEYK